jgi:hypothetical protein
LPPDDRDGTAGEEHMHVEVFGPCLLVMDVSASARFYIEHFGFQPRVELDWFTTLSRQDRPYELAFIRADHETVPEGYRGRRTQADDRAAGA